MEASDWIAIVACLLSAISFGWTWNTHRRQSRLDREHRELEAKVFQAQLADREAANEATWREVRGLAANLLTSVMRIADRKPTPDGLRGASIWSDDQLARLMACTAQLDDAMAQAGTRAAGALHAIANLVRPHLTKDVRRIVPLLDSESLTVNVAEAQTALSELIERAEGGPPSPHSAAEPRIPGGLHFESLPDGAA